MPITAIDLEVFIDRIINGEIISDKPLLTYLDNNNKEFFIFQDSGLNILLGQEGNGKTKFMTQVMIDVLRRIINHEIKLDGIIYFDTERPEPQYAGTIKHMYDKSKLSMEDFCNKIRFYSVSELNEREIKGILNNYLQDEYEKRNIIFLDHILPLVNDFNKVTEANEIDHLLKRLIKKGHVIVASIHMPYNGLVKGLGHLGSSLQRLASFILEITNSEDNLGFAVTQRKSRISSRSNTKLLLKKDERGNITVNEIAIVTYPENKKIIVDDEEIAIEILREFISSKLIEKKQLYSLIQIKKKWSSTSSAMSTFFNNNLKNLITFTKDGYTLTEKGVSELNVPK